MSLRNIVQRLRRECPWDRKQTLSSIRHLYIEEAYELAEALDAGDGQRIEEELGDLLYIVLMGIEIAAESGLTDYEKVEERASQKLIRRHPHVFGETEVSGEEQVLVNWEKIKQAEKGKGEGFFDGIPKSLPALIRAQMMQERAARVGFDWQDVKGPLAKIREETKELEAHIGQAGDDLERELGDLLFSAVNLARHIGVRAEEALTMSNKKFARRFEQVRMLAQQKKLDLAKLGIEELDRLWDEVKKSPQENS